MANTRGLKTLRAELGLSQTELAHALHVSFSTVNRWENEKSYPNKAAIVSVMKYAKKMGASEGCLDLLSLEYGYSRVSRQIERKELPKELLGMLADESISSVYVADYKTDELLYLNNTARKVLHAQGNIEPGQKCYEYLMHRDTPCPFCHKSLMSTEKFRENTIKFPFNGRKYRISSKIMVWGGRQVHIHYIVDVTDLLNHEKALRTLTDKIPSGIGIFHAYSDGRFEPDYLNDGYFKVLGSSRDKRREYEGFSAMKAVHPDDLPGLLDAITEAIQTETQLCQELRIRKDNGNYMWLRLRADIYDKNAERATLYCSFSDVDQLRKSLDLQQKENYYKQMDDVNLIAKGRYDINDNKLLYYEKKSGEALPLSDGVTFDYAKGLLVKTAAVKEQGEEIEKRLDRGVLLEEFAKGKKRGAIKYKRKDSKGAFYWTSIRYHMGTDPETNHVIFFIYSYDITKNMLEKNMLSILGDSEYEVMGTVDVRTHFYEIQEVSKHAKPIDKTYPFIAGNYDEVWKHNIEKYGAAFEKENLIATMKLENVVEKLKTESNFFVTYSILEENDFRRKKMQYCYLDDSRDTIFFYRSDITATYNREQGQLRKTEQALETARLANSAKTEFFSRMSHDMRTPMNGILGLANLSIDEKEPKVLQQNMIKIMESGKYLLSLINDTLDFQKIESGKLQLDPQPVYCKTVFQNVVDMIKPAMEKKKINFQVNNHNLDYDCYLEIDPVRTRQIFINLLSNAVKFTPEGGTIYAETECLHREGDWVRDVFIIRDTGIGMSKDFLQNHIFKPFSQETSQEAQQYAGTGLGLSIVHSLVEMMGGSIEVESELGTGTTFTLYLDFKKLDEESIIRQKKEDKKQGENLKNELEGINILLAEDHPLNAEIAKKLLEKVGCNVTWVKNGQECVDLFDKADKGRQFNIILMDIRMPFMDGLTATKTIRQMDKDEAKEIPILAMTANAYDEDVKKSIAAGMNGHISKPIDPTIMYKRIAENIHIRGQNDVSRTID